MTVCVEEERHKAFQALRKKHYEMKDAIKLGHQLEEEDEDEEEESKQDDPVDSLEDEGEGGGGGGGGSGNMVNGHEN